MDLNTRLKHLRLEKNWSLARTARKAGVSLSTYRDWERGSKIPADQLLKLAVVHSVSISQLFGQRTVSNVELGKAIKSIEEGLLCIRNALPYL